MIKIYKNINLYQNKIKKVQIYKTLFNHKMIFYKNKNS